MTPFESLHPLTAGRDIMAGTGNRHADQDKSCRDNQRLNPGQRHAGDLLSRTTKQGARVFPVSRGSARSANG